MILNDFYTTEWLPYQTERLRENTLTGYESAWRLHIQPRFGGMEMEDIRRKDVEEWAQGLDSAGAAHKAWAVLRSILRKAVRWEMLEFDRFAGGVDLPKLEHKESPWLQPSDLRQLLAGFFGHRLEAWLLVSATLGLRREEGLALEWSDIDLKRGIVHITKGLQWINGHELLVEPKTALSKRDLVLGPLVKRRLKEIKKATGGKGRLIGDLNPLQVARQYKSYCERNGLPYVPPMNLRTTWATNALKAGIDISIVAKFLGHSNIQTTARYYLMQDIEVLRDTAVIWETKILKENGVWSFGRAA